MGATTQDLWLQRTLNTTHHAFAAHSTYNDPACSTVPTLESPKLNDLVFERFVSLTNQSFPPPRFSQYLRITILFSDGPCTPFIYLSCNLYYFFQHILFFHFHDGLFSACLGSAWEFCNIYRILPRNVFEVSDFRRTRSALLQWRPYSTESRTSRAVDEDLNTAARGGMHSARLENESGVFREGGGKARLMRKIIYLWLEMTYEVRQDG